MNNLKQPATMIHAMPDIAIQVSGHFVWMICECRNPSATAKKRPKIVFHLISSDNTKISWYRTRLNENAENKSIQSNVASERLLELKYARRRIHFYFSFEFHLFLGYILVLTESIQFKLSSKHD